jgi:hypothetical protein
VRELREPPEDDDVDGRGECGYEDRPRDTEERLLVADDDVPPDERLQELPVMPKLPHIEVRPAPRGLDDEGPPVGVEVCLDRPGLRRGRRLRKLELCLAHRGDAR